MFMLLLGMWRTLTSILGLSRESDTEEDDEAEEPSAPDCTVASSQHPLAEEQQEFIGVVTSLHSAYGLINHEICFTPEAVSGNMPMVGDKVHVVSCRKNAAGGWRAKRVWLASDNDFLNEAETAESCHVTRPPACNVDTRTAASSSEKNCQELLHDKDGISITEFIDFGSVQLGESSSLIVVIRYCFIH